VIRARALAAAVVAGALWAAAPRPALAAFEVRDASPMALGAVSMDLDEAAHPGRRTLVPGGLELGASHATLFDVEGLTAEQGWIVRNGRGAGAALSVCQVGPPGARETRVRASLKESPARPIALSVAVERLRLELDGEPPSSGWTLGFGAGATRSLAGVDLDISVRADRLFRSTALEQLAVTPSVPVSFRVSAGAASAAWVDRWEGDGRRSPRLVIDFALGDAARIRFGRGERPDRIGAALAIRWRRLQISAGRLDVASGGSVGAASLGFVPATAERVP
jgi:hypothetical protein